VLLNGGMRHAFLAAAIGLAILVSGGAAGAGQEPGEKPAFKRTSVELLNKSGKVQLVEFYHPT
jgi:hypothetical protein